MYYVYSTLATDMRYVQYKASTTPAVIEHEVLIVGKANVATKHLITPRGIVTNVKDEDYEILKDNYLNEK